jgi:hypothetical protein
MLLPHHHPPGQLRMKQESAAMATSVDQKTITVFVGRDIKTKVGNHIMLQHPGEVLIYFESNVCIIKICHNTLRLIIILTNTVSIGIVAHREKSNSETTRNWRMSRTSSGKSLRLSKRTFLYSERSKKRAESRTKVGEQRRLPGRFDDV